MFMPGDALRAWSAYKPTETDRLLSFDVNDRFAVLKETSADAGWIWSVDLSGHFGYVPVNFVKKEQLSELAYAELLMEFIDGMQARLVRPDVDAKTKKHLQHEQSKLARCVQAVEKQVRVKFSLENQPAVAPKRLPKGEAPVGIMKNGSRNPSPNPKVMPKSASAASIDAYTIEAASLLSIASCPPAPSNGKSFEEHRTDLNESTPSSSANCTEKQVKSTKIIVKEQKQNVVEAENCASINCGEFVHELLEILRSKSDLPYQNCMQTLQALLTHIYSKLPLTAQPQTLQNLLDVLNKKDSLDEFANKSNDLNRLQCLMEKMWASGQDEQQLDWPIHQDESALSATLDEILHLLRSASPAVVRLCVCKDQCENVATLIGYLHMERRAPLRERLQRILLRIGATQSQVIEQQMLCSLLPIGLAVELADGIRTATSGQVSQRWQTTARLFALVFSTGHKPPISVYEQVNQRLFASLFELLEERLKANTFNRCTEDKLLVEDILAPVLAFNLHFDQDEADENPVLKALSASMSAAALLQHLVSYLIWGEDPTRLSALISAEEGKWAPELQQSPDFRSHVYIHDSVHKLLYEAFADTEIASLFYFNDVSVLVDVLINQLHNLPAKSDIRTTLISLLKNVLLNTSYIKESEKVAEIDRLIQEICANQSLSEKEKNIAKEIKKNLTN